MGLLGKVSMMLEIKSKGDLLHQLFGHNPHQVSGIVPEKIQGCECDLHDGNWGAPESTICWKYTHDGKERIAKQIIDIDEEKKMVTMKIVEGDLMKLYKTFTAHLHVYTSGDTHFATWVFDYEKLNDDVEEPLSLSQFVINLTKDIETHHLKN